MDEVMHEYIGNLDLGPVTTFNDMSVIPIFSPVLGPQYLTLKEALEQDLLIITEVDESGRVGELKVKNLADIPVLLLDGEEIMGAKQNRVLNSTILVAGGSEIVIPVSCTEQGRWNYHSRRFRDSDVIAAHRVRRAKSISVKENLRSVGDFRSNQQMVWNEINELSRDARVKSKTRAMKDVYQSHHENLNDYLQAFTPKENQKGIMVLINGRIAGFEVVSSSKAYKLLHDKLVKSYALDAMLSPEEKETVVEQKEARKFLEEALKTDDTRHKSAGYGYDHRYQGKQLVGSSLIFKNSVIHTAFFKMDD